MWRFASSWNQRSYFSTGKKHEIKTVSFLVNMRCCFGHSGVESNDLAMETGTSLRARRRAWQEKYAWFRSGWL
jgi:hypothetical protein